MGRYMFSISSPQHSQQQAIHRNIASLEDPKQVQIPRARSSLTIKSVLIVQQLASDAVRRQEDKYALNSNKHIALEFHYVLLTWTGLWLTAFKVLTSTKSIYKRQLKFDNST